MTYGVSATSDWRKSALGFEPYGHAFDFTHTIPQIVES
jgi:hypothetical protein